jgi:hypothetical protein
LEAKGNDATLIVAIEAEPEMRWTWGNARLREEARQVETEAQQIAEAERHGELKRRDCEWCFTSSCCIAETGRLRSHESQQLSATHLR